MDKEALRDNFEFLMISEWERWGKDGDWAHVRTAMAAAVVLLIGVDGGLEQDAEFLQRFATFREIQEVGS